MDNLNKAIEKALLTWYPKDHPLHFVLRHPAIKLAGEAGEILDLYGKDQYKPGFDWWNCKHCEKPIWDHLNNTCFSTTFLGSYGIVRRIIKMFSIRLRPYTPMILDELGDLWYYLRILAYQNKIELKYYSFYRTHSNTLEINLFNMYILAGEILNDMLANITSGQLCQMFVYLVDILQLLDSDIDQLTELNYIKLNSDDTNHGWKRA